MNGDMIYIIKKNNNHYNCDYCNKKYTRKSDYDRHHLLCKELYYSKMDDEEITDLPSQKQMYKIIRELVFKCNKMEERMNEMQKWVKKNKKKINVIEWLNVNVIPTSNFSEFMEKLNIHTGYIEYLIENSFANTVSLIFEDFLKKDSETKNPIYSFVQNVNIFYIYNEKGVWTELTKDELIKILNRIHHRLSNKIVEWKKINEKKFDDMDKLYDIYNKTLLKILNITSFKDDNILSKMKTILYNHLKVDFKNIIDYDFEF